MKTPWPRILAASLFFVTGSSQGFVPHLPSHYEIFVGQTVVVQVLSTSTSADLPFDIASVDATFTYDSSSLAFVAARAGSSLLGGTNPPLVTPNDTGSEVIVGIAVIQPQPLSEDGVLLELEFVVQAGISDQTIVGMTRLSLNEDAMQLTSADVSEEDGIVSTSSELSAGSSIISIIVAVCARPGANC